MAVLIFFLVIEDLIIGSRLRDFLIESEVAHSRLDVDLMGAASLEAILMRDYVSVGSTLNRLGREHHHIVSIVAVAPNGFNLAEYRREVPAAGDTYVVKRSVRYGDDEVVALEMVGDLQEVEAMVGRVTSVLVVASIVLMACLGVMLWYTQKKMALMPLELEIRRRKDAEGKLEKARDELEVRVEERTEALRQEFIERHRAERAVGEKEEYIRLLLASTAEAIYGIDMDGRCTFCNPSCLRMLGYSDEADLLGRNMHEIMHHSHVDGTQYPQESCKACEAFRGERGVHSDDEVFWRKDGTSFPAEYWAFPIFKDEKVTGAVVTFMDITKRREAEEENRTLLSKLKTLIEHMPEGVFVLDAQKMLTMTNPVANEYLQVVTGVKLGEKLESIAGHSLEVMLVSPPQILWHDVEAAGRVFEVGGRLLSDGGIVFVMRDVTKDRELDKRLRLQERLAAVGQLAAGIAHDFNNILTVINGYTEMLLTDAELAEENRVAVEAVYQSGEKAAELIHQILDFSRQTVGAMEPVDMSVFLNEFLAFIKRTIPETIKINLDVAGEDRFIVEADSTKLQQVFANLVVNARDVMPEGGELTIRVTDKAYAFHDKSAPLEELKGMRWVLVEVMDTGAGIDEEVLPHIFEPFYTTKATGQGTGLGLPQVYGLVKQHGGLLNVLTSPEGTTFQVFLPMTVRLRKHEEVDETVEVPMGQGETVLVAEDEEVVRRLVVSVLKNLGYNALQASNGKEALEVYDQHGEEVAMTITDIVMPEMDGIKLTRELKKRNPAMKILAISGYTVGLGDDVMEDAGISALIRKPFKVKELAGIISKHLSNKS